MSGKFLGISVSSSRTSASRTTQGENPLSPLVDLGFVKRPKSGSKKKDSKSRPRTAVDAGDVETYPRKNFSVSNGTAQPELPYKSAGGNYNAGHARPSIPLDNHFGHHSGAMSGMLSADRSGTRRERTFVGSECAVCEEPLEHTLSGERILQFSCGHVSHGACFREYLLESDIQHCPTCDEPLGLDTSPPGNGIDQAQEYSSASGLPRGEDMAPFSGPDEIHTSRDVNNDELVQGIESNIVDAIQVGESDNGNGYTAALRDGGGGDMEANASSRHYRGTLPGGLERQQTYDSRTLDTNLLSPRVSSIKNPIPPPTIHIRSEFPTITKSRQQQLITCLVSIEVADNKWRPDPEDLEVAPPIIPESTDPRPPSPAHSASNVSPYESPEILEEVTDSLRQRVENWHGLDFSRFGKLRLYGTIRVGKDKHAWQELECYLFSEMLICIKEKKQPKSQWIDPRSGRKMTRCTLKGSILIKKHLDAVTQSSPNKAAGLADNNAKANRRSAEDNILTLSLSVAELPSFHLQFNSLNQLKLWEQALLDLQSNAESSILGTDYDAASYEARDAWNHAVRLRRGESQRSKTGHSIAGATDSTPTTYQQASPASIHVPLDIVVVVPVSASMQGVKVSLVRDALKFMVQNLGDRDRMGLVTFGSSGGGVPLVGLMRRTWSGWTSAINNIQPLGQKSHRADVVEGANAAMDLLMQRKAGNPLASILLISDSSAASSQSLDFVVSRAEAAKVTIHTFGLGMTHKPDVMLELSTRTKASYTYVKDWMILRECLAGCLGALQTISHQNVRLKLKIPEGATTKFVKVSGALQNTTRATGRDAEAALGDLKFGDKRDVLVQLVIPSDSAVSEQLPQDPWETIVSGLEALGGTTEPEEQRPVSAEELPLIQADLTWGDVLRDGILTHLPSPSLLAITLLPVPQAQKKTQWTQQPPIPPHSSIVQRRMELLAADMLSRALTLVAREQNERAQQLLNETRTILKGLGKGSLPPVPPSIKASNSVHRPSTANTTNSSLPSNAALDSVRTPSPASSPRSQLIRSYSNARSTEAIIGSGPGIDPAIVAALDAELENSLEWINHPAVFARDSQKAVLQAIGVISNQRAYTFRSPIESLWAGHLSGVKRLTKRSQEWREETGAEAGLMESS